MNAVPIKNSVPTGGKRPACGLDYAMEDIAAGRINHYSSLDELIRKFE